MWDVFSFAQNMLTALKSCKAKTVKQDFKKEICDLIECRQVTYEDGELTVAVGDTEVFGATRREIHQYCY